MLATVKRIFSCICLAISIIILQPTTISAQDSLAFGNKDWVAEGLEGKIYFISPGTLTMPRFDTMTAQGKIYTKKIDVPVRNWNTGFPGVPDRHEWFGVVYEGDFKVKKPGKYIFRLFSDDGSKLFIDEKLIIDNDGQHPPNSRLGEIMLDDKQHSIRLEYFQGPAMQIALQLFATREDEDEQLFSSENFTFITPAKKKTFSNILIYVAAGFLLFMIIFFWMRKKRRMPTA
jgi:PA14 domain